MIKEIRELTGLGHEQLGAWLGLSRSMVQFAEFSFRSLSSEASKKLLALAPVVQQLQEAARAGRPQPVAFTEAAAFAVKHQAKMEHHLGTAGKLQRQLDRLRLQETKLAARLVLLDAMKKLETELYSSTAADQRKVDQLESFSRDHLKHIAAKLQPLQDKIEMHRAYGEVHSRLWQQYKAMENRPEAGDAANPGS